MVGKGERWSCSASDLDNAKSVVVDTESNAYVTGSSRDSEGNNNCATIKYGPDGSELRAMRYADAHWRVDSAFALAIDETGGIYVTGLSIGDGTAFDYVTIRYKENLLGRPSA